MLHRIVCRVAFFSGIVAWSQLPPSSVPRQTMPQGTASASSDVVQGIAGLMGRVGQLQPQLGQLPEADVARLGQDGQRLHERFLELQEKLQRTGAQPGASDEAQLLNFHKDLALFVQDMENQLGIIGPSSSLGSSARLPVSSLPPLPSLSDRRPDAQANFASQQALGTAISPGTDRRLQTAMSGVVNGMQRFQSLHQQLRILPPEALSEISRRGQQLHEEFSTLQQQGVALTGDNAKQMSEADGAEYASRLEDFSKRMISFIGDTESRLQGSPGNSLPPAGVGLGSGGMLGSASLGGGLGAGSIRGNLGGDGLGGDRITPATDKRLSAVVENVVSKMKEFEALRPQLSRVPQQALAKIAQRGQELNDRFMALQQRGARIAGDGSTPMPEREASEYVVEMEAFHSDQVAYVDQARQALQSGGGLGSAAPLGSATLGSASLSGSTLGASTPLGSGSLGGPSLGGSLGSGGALGSSLLGGSILGQSSNTMLGGRNIGGSPGDTDTRLSNVLEKVSGAMKEFEALKPSLSRLSQQVFAQIAQRGEKMNDRFIALQQRGVAMAGDGSKPLPVQEASAYATDMETFHVDQKAFVEEAKHAVQSGGGFGSAAVPPPGGFSNPSLGGGIAPNAGTGGLPPLSLGSIGTPQAQGLDGDRITPATDKRLSAVIEKVTNTMQGFEALRPQLSRLPQQALARIGQLGQELNDRFIALQQRGAKIAGDGSTPMPEREASEYVIAMEAFHADQVAYVDQARQALQSGGSAAPLGSATLGAASLSGSSLGASAPFGSGSFGGSSLGGGSLGSINAGAPPVSAFGSLGSPSLGRGSLNSGTFGASFGSGTLGGGSVGSANFGQNSFQSGGSIGSSSLEGSSGPSLGSLGISKMGNGGFNSRSGGHQGGIGMQDSLTNFGAAKLDTNILRGL